MGDASPTDKITGERLPPEAAIIGLSTVTRRPALQKQYSSSDMVYTHHQRLEDPLGHLNVPDIASVLEGDEASSSNIPRRKSRPTIFCETITPSEPNFRFTTSNKTSRLVTHHQELHDPLAHFNFPTIEEVIAGRGRIQRVVVPRAELRKRNLVPEALNMKMPPRKVSVSTVASSGAGADEDDVIASFPSLVILPVLPVFTDEVEEVHYQW